VNSRVQERAWLTGQAPIAVKRALLVSVRNNKIDFENSRTPKLLSSLDEVVVAREESQGRWWSCMLIGSHNFASGDALLVPANAPPHY
jgi:hypothetical protein